eukprot:1151426-Pelagomonas_calceolata.AAC.1
MSALPHCSQTILLFMRSKHSSCMPHRLPLAPESPLHHWPPVITPLHPSINPKPVLSSRVFPGVETALKDGRHNTRQGHPVAGISSNASFVDPLETSRFVNYFLFRLSKGPDDDARCFTFVFMVVDDGGQVAAQDEQRFCCNLRQATQGADGMQRLQAR